MKRQKKEKTRKRTSGCGNYQLAGPHPLSRLLQLPAPLFAGGMYFPLPADEGKEGAREGAGDTDAEAADDDR